MTSGVSLTWGLTLREPGQNSWKIVGYFRMNSIGRKGIWRVSFACVTRDSGADFEGSEMMRSLRLMTGLRCLSRATA